MKTKLIVSMLAIATILTGCDKAPKITSDSRQVQAEPFKGQAYRSLDGQMTLTLISSEECEINDRGTIFLCKYQKQSDALRVVATTGGTNQVFYFSYTSQGIQDTKGTVLLSPEKYAETIEQASIAGAEQARRRAPIIEALTHVKQIDLSLQRFYVDYGTYPNDETAEKVRQKSQTNVLLGNSTSNDYLRQLIAGRYINSEEIFFANILGVHKPDNNIEGVHCLEAGENAYAYVVGLSLDDIDAPILLAPMIRGTLTFDPKPFNGKAIVFRIDSIASRNQKELGLMQNRTGNGNGSIDLESIDSNGHVITNGMDIFDPKQPFWHGKPPIVRYPL